MKSEHMLNIQGHAFVIRAEAEPERIRKVEDLVNERLDEMGLKGAPLQSVLLLATLNLAQDLIDEQDSHKQLKEKIRSGSSTLLKKLDSHAFAA